MRLQLTAPSSTKRLAIVARVSTEDQEEFGTSLVDQIGKGKLLAQLHDYSVDERPYTDGGHIYKGDESGALPLAQRPIMRRLIADAKAHRFEAVCFTKIDRIARWLKYILEIWDALDDAGVTVLVIDPAIDTSTPIGRLIRNVLGSIAEFERDTILERTMGGRRRKLASEDGLFLPKGKYGYTYTPKNSQTHTPGHVSINEQHAAVVTRIYQRKAQRVSEERIAVELTADGIPRPDGKLPWYGSTVSRILRDRAYLGTGKWGVTQAVRTERGTRVKRKRVDGRGVIEVSYPPIVTPDMWHAAQPDSEQGKTCVKRADADRYLLHTGMVRCAEHGRSMGGSHNGSGNAQYCCVRKLSTGRRTKHTVPGRRLDQVVWDDVAAFLLEPARGIAASRALVAQAEEELGEVSRLRASNAARRAELSM
jgi:site-specific DNA recombinase